MIKHLIIIGLISFGIGYTYSQHCKLPLIKTITKIEKVYYTNSPVIITNQTYLGKSEDLLNRATIAATMENQYELAAAIGFLQIISMSTNNLLRSAATALQIYSRETIKELAPEVKFTKEGYAY